MPQQIQKNQLTSSTFTWLKIALFGSITLALSACGQSEQAVKKAPPAPAVSVYQINNDDVGNYREFVARTKASKEANLRARVEGELIERHFKEGSLVKKDQVLLKIDPTAYETALESAKADLNSRIAGAEGAARDLKRGKKIAGDGYISQSDLDKLTTNAAQTKAAVKVAQAALETAELNLSYTVIQAPFSGRIGKVNYNVGNVIGPNSDVLATLILTDPIYVSFQVEEAAYVTYLQKHHATNSPRDIPIDISMRLPNNSDYPEKGTLDFADTKIEQGTGTVELRAVFKNTSGIILPGLFVSLVIESTNKQKMALVPQAAVQESQQGKFVLVVDDENKVIQRHVTLGRRINAMWVVEKGLKEKEKVVIEGLQKVRPGITVKAIVKEVDMLTGTISNSDAK